MRLVAGSTDAWITSGSSGDSRDLIKQIGRGGIASRMTVGPLAARNLRVARFMHFDRGC
jgi:hypothetical protein